MPHRGAGSVPEMKIRIGMGLGTRSVVSDGEAFGALVDGLEHHGFDSLWLSERINGPAPDPLAALAFAAGRTAKLKLGTSVLILPGRTPALLAKELATIDRLSNGRLLPAVGLGAVDPVEQSAFGVDRADRGPIFDEMLPLLRRLWREDAVDHEGRYFTLAGVRVAPKPVQETIDIWLGGRAPSELRRVGRLGDGWLPSFCTADDVRVGIPAIVAEAERHERAIDPEHFGALIAYREGDLPDVVAAFLARRQPDVDPDAVIPRGLDGVRAMIEQMVEAGASKFVVLPFAEPSGTEAWADELGRIADALFPLQT